MFTLAAVAPLALGLGATVAMFTVAESVLYRPLAVADPGSLVAIYETNDATSGARSPLSADTFLDLQERTRSFTGIAAFDVPAVSLPWGGDAVDVPYTNVTANFFQVLGVAPILGRTDEDSSYLIAEPLWRRRFGANPSVVGKTVAVFGDEYSFPVAGVMPRSFTFPPGVETWSVGSLPKRAAPRSGARYLWAVARLRRGTSLSAARAEVESVSRQLASDFPGTDAGWVAHVLPLTDVVVGPARRPILAVGVVAVLLLTIACVNLVSLLLARSIERRREMGIRLALGAGRLHLFRLILIEGVLLAVAAGIVGAAVAWGTIRGMLAIAPALIPRANEISVDPLVLGFAVLLPLVVAVGVAIASGALALRHSPEAAFSSQRYSHENSRTQLGFIVAGEVAVAVVLAAAAAVALSSYSRLTSSALGFDRSQVSITRYLPLPSSFGSVQRRLLSGQRAPDPREVFRVWTDEMLDAVAALPGVSGAAVGEYTPFDERAVAEKGIRIHARGLQSTAPNASTAVVTSVSPEFFSVLGVPLIHGRWFDRQDRASTMPVALVSAAAARRFWGSVKPVGTEIQIDGETTPRTVVGVVSDLALVAPGETPRAIVYLPLAQYARAWLGLLVRSTSPPGLLAPGIRKVLQNSWLRPLDTASLNDLFDRTVAKPRLVSWTVTSCAAIALLVGTAGIFATSVFGLRQRRRELAVRIAVGASPRRIVSQVLGDSLRWILVGLAVGLPAATGLGTVASGVLSDMPPLNPIVLLGAALVTVAAGAAGALLPALRAGKTDPVDALRAE